MQEPHFDEGGQSLEPLHNEESARLQISNCQKNKVRSKIQQNKQFNCLHIFKNILYLGTRNSRLYIYQINLDQQSQHEGQDFILKQIKMITPQYKKISIIKANENYFVTVPQTENQSYISIWSAQTNQFLVAREGHKSQVSQIIFMKDNKNLVSSSWDSTIKIWSLQDFEKLQATKTYKGNYPILELKELDDDVLIFGGDDCYLVFWNWKKGEVIKKQFGHAGSVTYIEVMRQFVFTAGGDNKFKFWEVIYTQSTNTITPQDHDHDFKSKYKIKKVAQHKNQYDSIIFGTFYDCYLLLIDKQGEVFLITEQVEIYRMGNYFDTNQEITSVDVFGSFLLVTTTKGVLKHINMKSEISKLTFSQFGQKAFPSQTKILKIDSKLSESNKNKKNSVNFDKDPKKK